MMKQRAAIAAMAIFGFVLGFAGSAIAAPTGDCRMTASFIDTPSGRQIEAIGASFTANEPITLGGSTPTGTITVELPANEQGNWIVELEASEDGRYVVGPATGTICSAPPVTLVTPGATARPTLPPLPSVTMPPTDTD
jgi:hypothetical protein